CSAPTASAGDTGADGNGDAVVGGCTAAEAAKGRSSSADTASATSLLSTVSAPVADRVVTLGAVPAPIHSAFRIASPRLFAAGCTLSAYSFASIPFGNRIRKQSGPSPLSFSDSFTAAALPASSRS